MYDANTDWPRIADTAWPRINTQAKEAFLVAVDIGNSSIKFGLFPRENCSTVHSQLRSHTSKPHCLNHRNDSKLPIAHDTGSFD